MSHAIVKATNEGNGPIQVAFHYKVFVPERGHKRHFYVVSPVTNRCSFFIECLSVLMLVMLFPGPQGPKGAAAGALCPPKPAEEGRTDSSQSQAPVDPQRGIHKARSFLALKAY